MTGRAGDWSSRRPIAAAGLAAIAALLAAPAMAQDSDPPLAVPAPPPGAALPEVEPDIADDEFEKAVPELSPLDDPEMNRELESIELFEQRLSEQERKAGQEAPLGDPALADGDTSEEIADAKIRDTELTQPLPPLESFEVTPVEFAQPEPDSESASVAYRTEITGLEKVDAETTKGLRALFNGLSALRDGDGKAANVAMIQAWLEEDSALMQTILASEGWYSAEVTTRIDLAAAEGEKAGAMTAVIDVVPGKRYALGKIDVVAGPTEPLGLISDNLALKLGEPIVADRVQGAEAKVSLALPASATALVMARK